MSPANLSVCNQSKHIEPIRLVAWHIAEEFKTLPTEKFARSIKLDDKKNKAAQQRHRWWEDQTTYLVPVAAHVGENLKWWSLSPDEKDAARVLEKMAKGSVIVIWRDKTDAAHLCETEKSNAIAQEIFQKKFPFDTAFVDGGQEPGLPSKNVQITDLGCMITHPDNKALIVAYLEGLTAIYEDETRANRLSKLTVLPRLDEEGVQKLSEFAGEAAKKAEAGEWKSFNRTEAAEEVRRLLPLW